MWINNETANDIHMSILTCGSSHADILELPNEISLCDRSFFTDSFCHLPDAIAHYCMITFETDAIDRSPSDRLPISAQYPSHNYPSGK